MAEDVDESYYTALYNTERVIRVLMAREGLTPEKLEFVGYLQQDLGVSSGLAVYDVIQNALEGMPQDMATQALRNAFGGEGMPDRLPQRREQLARELGITVNRVKDLEKVATKRLAATLLRDRTVTVTPESYGVLAVALFGLQQAVTKQTDLLREIRAKLDAKQ